MKDREIILIAALGDENRVIGKGLKLPWHIPEDLRRFKRLTKGYPMIMGRLTYQSLINQFGRQLPGRPHLVLTSRPDQFDYPGAQAYPNMEAALAACEDFDKVFIAGGAKVYAQGLDISDVWELTFVEGSHEGDVFFPPFKQLLGVTHRMIGCENRDGFRFETFQKIG